MSDRLFLTAAEVRQRFAARMAQLRSPFTGIVPGEETQEPTSYTESPKALGPEGDGTEVGDKRFSVLMMREVAVGMRRGDNDSLIRYEQEITLRVQYLLRPNAEGDQLSDYDRAVGPEARAILGWLLAIGPWCLGIHPIAYEDGTRAIVRDGRFLIVDYHFTAQHNAQLVG